MLYYWCCIRVVVKFLRFTVTQKMDSSYSNSPRGTFEGRTMFLKNITKGRNSSVSSQCLLDDVSEGDFAGVTLVCIPATPEPEVADPR